MPDWIKEGGPTVIVALGAIWMFLQAFDRWGVSRDKEREAFLASLREQQKAFTEGILALVGLATTMVSGCQSHVPEQARITNSEVMQAADIQPEEASERKRST